MGPDLAARMLARADADRLPSNHPLRVRASKLKDALTGEFNPKRVIGCWARARKAWCDYTGEDLADV